MYEHLLLESGLTQNEVKVYLTLLKLGKSQSGKIVKESNVASGKIYETLNKLLEKGLIELSVENGVKQFSASNPDSLLLFLNEKKEKLEQQTKKVESIIPQLKSLLEFNPQPEGVFLIKSFRGIKPIVYDLFKHTSGEFLVMGVRSSKRNKFNIFWEHWHQQRVKENRKSKLLFSDIGTNYWNFFKNLKLTESRSLSSLSPSAVMIVDSEVFIFSYEEDLTCVHIKSKPIAASFTSFFNSMWKIAKN